MVKKNTKIWGSVMAFGGPPAALLILISIGHGAHG